jgi:signal transduction histidine kinase
MEHLETHRYDLAFANLPEPTLLVDEDGRLARVNTAAEALLGDWVPLLADQGETVSRALPWLGHAVERVLAGADEDSLEARVATYEGFRRVAARLRRVRERGGAPRGVIAVLEDLTEKSAVEARRRSSERLTALGTLAAGLAHEVNNPLACVVAGLSFLEAEHTRIASALGPAELREAKVALEEARDAARRVGRIVQSMQSFGRPATPLLHEVELSQVLRAAMQLAEPEVRARARLVAEISNPVKVRASESLLVELFLALLVNAAQAIDPGDPAANAIHVTLLAAQGEAHVVVSDSGAGMAEDVRGRVCDPFFTTRPGKGAGLGLSVSHGIVSALGGTLAFDSAPGRGTRAIVRLPLDATGG